MSLSQPQTPSHIPAIEACEGKGALLFGEVGGGLRARGEKEEYEDRKEEGGEAFDEEEDTPLGYAGVGEGGDAV